MRKATSFNNNTSFFSEDLLNSDYNANKTSKSFPTIFPISFSHSEFPTIKSVVDETGLPFGFVVAPFIRDDNKSLKESKRSCFGGENLARCNSCGIYINPFCEITNLRWFCSHCGNRNPFIKSQSRYRNVDLRQLPETQDILADYRLPMNKNVNSVPISEKPLVHIFVIQESMRIDTLQATIESLSHSIPFLHPEMKIILLTFSHRIGIYRLSTDGGASVVQYAHFSNNGQAIFEGNTLQEVVENSSSNKYEQNITLLEPLSDVVSFLDAAVDVGSCRDSLQSTLNSIFDSFPCESLSSSREEGTLPKVMLGPVLNAIHSWLSEPPRVDEIQIFGEDTDGDKENAVNQVIKMLGVGNWFSNRTISNSGDEKYEDKSPISDCTGVILHLFLDSPQDIAEDSHESVSESKFSDILKTYSQTDKSKLSEHLIDIDWSNALAKQFSEMPICINIWSVSSFAHEEVGISTFDSLSTMTGGKIHRIVLGVYPKEERIRMAESLKKVLTTKLAMNCILKFRASSSIDIKEETMTGLVIADDKHDGVFKMSSCTPESSVSFEIGYNKDIEDNRITLQMAFSFYTLEESDVDLTTSVKNENTMSPYLDSAYETLEIRDLSGKLVKTTSYDNIDDKGIKTTSSKSSSFVTSKEYRHDKGLVVIKTLRILTVSIPCSSNVNRVQNSCHLPTITSLLFRRAIYENKKYFNSNSAISAVSNVENCNLLKRLNLETPGFRTIISTAISYVLKKAKESHNEEISYLAVLKDSQNTSILKMLYSILDYLVLYSVQKSCFTDDAAEFYNNCQNLDAHYCYRVLYPQLTPLTSELFLESKCIKLSRESVVSSGAPYLLVDSLFEIVLYKNIIVSSINSVDEKSASLEKPNQINSLIYDIQRRLQLTPYSPKFFRSEAGFASSNYFISHLIEDISRSGFVFNDFIELINSLLEQ